MPISVVLIGGLRDDISNSALLERLQTASVSVQVNWDWVYAASPHWQPKPKEMNRFLDRLYKWQAAKRKNDPTLEELFVVKLYDLHGRASNDLFRVWKEPKLVPYGVFTADGLIEWLLSADAGLIPLSSWVAGPIGAALVAILSKLLKNKRWAGSVAGHDFLKEIDLLTQSPVDRSGHAEVAIEAKKMLDSLADGILFTKGGSKTSKEWAINTLYLPQIKRAFTERSFAPLEEIKALEGLLRRISGEPASIELLGEIVTERILYFCQTEEEKQENK
jgi:hypothetical protein